MLWPVRGIVGFRFHRYGQTRRAASAAKGGLLQGAPFGLPPEVLFRWIRLDEQKAKAYYLAMDEGRKRVILIAASILVARHMKDGLGERSPRVEALIANAIRLAERIMQRIENTFQPDAIR